MVLGSDAWMNKHHVKRHGTSLRGQTRVNQRRLGCMSRGNSLSDELEISSVLGALPKRFVSMVTCNGCVCLRVVPRQKTICPE